MTPDPQDIAAPPDRSDAAWLRAHADQMDVISSAKIVQSDAARFRAIADRLDEAVAGAPEPTAWSPGKIGELHESETGSLYCLVGRHLFRPREDGYWTRDDGSLCCTPCLTRRQRAEDVVVRLRKAEAERDAALIAADDKRHSLAQEIAGCLRSRGAKWVPDTRERSYDLIPALGQFLDAAVARAEAAEAQVAALTAERDRLNVLEGIADLLDSICAAWSIRVAAPTGGADGR